jgi:hypothetical protein
MRAYAWMLAGASDCETLSSLSSDLLRKTQRIRQTQGPQSRLGPRPVGIRGLLTTPLEYSLDYPQQQKYDDHDYNDDHDPDYPLRIQLSSFPR